MSFTNYLESAVLNHVFRNTVLSSPTTIYAGLFTVAPDETGGGTEASGSAYARQAITFDAPADDAGAMQILNSNLVEFTPDDAPGWTDTLAIGFFDAATAGNLLDFGTYPVASATQTGDKISFPVGSISIKLG